MTLAWPSGVVGNIQTEIPMALGNPQTSPLTGSTQGGGSSVILWQLDVEFPPINDLAKVRAIRNILAKAKQDTVAIQVRQPGFTVGTTGVTVVNSGHTVGTKALPIFGAATSLAMFSGQFLSISTGGRWYLYTLDADSAAGSASRNLTLTSTTRASHAIFDPVEISTPWIEGWIEQSSISVNAAGHYVFRLSIKEAR